MAWLSKPPTRKIPLIIRGGAFRQASVLLEEPSLVPLPWLEEQLPVLWPQTRLFRLELKWVLQ